MVDRQGIESELKLISCSIDFGFSASTDGSQLDTLRLEWDVDGAADGDRETKYGQQSANRSGSQSSGTLLEVTQGHNSAADQNIRAVLLQRRRVSVLQAVVDCPTGERDPADVMTSIIGKVE